MRVYYVCSPRLLCGLCGSRESICGTISQISNDFDVGWSPNPSPSAKSIGYSDYDERDGPETAGLPLFFPSFVLSKGEAMTDDIVIRQIEAIFQWNGVTERGKEFLRSETSSADPTLSPSWLRLDRSNCMMKRSDKACGFVLPPDLGTLW